MQQRLVTVKIYQRYAIGGCEPAAADTNNDGLGDNPKNLSNTVGQESAPAYSPSGARIAFQSNRDGNVEKYVMDATTGNPQTNLSRKDAADFQPAWQPLP
jgi:Tol biopolymer transport system component